jgi:hypothetical protein
LNPEPSVVQAVASRYTDYTIPALHIGVAFKKITLYK